MPFCATDAASVATCTLDGAPLQSLGADVLRSRAKLLGLPRIGDEQQLRLLIAVLQAHVASERAQASGASGSSSGSASVLPPNTWQELREETKGLLLLAVRREGKLSASTAEALNVLNKPQVVEKYKLLGNRWTIPEEKRDAPSAVERARKELGGDSAGVSTGQWLRTLADALEEAPEERPWYTSKAVLAIVALAAAFVLVHVVLLVRVLQKVHFADNRVLLYPVAGLSMSAVVGAFAIGVHKLSEPPKKVARD